MLKAPTLKRNLTKCHGNKGALSTIHGNQSSNEPFHQKFPLVVAGAAIVLSGFMKNNEGNNYGASTVRCAALHPSPTPVAVGSEKDFEDKVDLSGELELPTYTR